LYRSFNREMAGDTDDRWNVCSAISLQRASSRWRRLRKRQRYSDARKDRTARAELRRLGLLKENFCRTPCAIGLLTVLIVITFESLWNGADRDHH